MADDLRRHAELARAQDLGRAIGRAVVDDHELGHLGPRLDGVEDALERRLLVVDRDEDREPRGHYPGP
jgi:hypothetical protein